MEENKNEIRTEEVIEESLPQVEVMNYGFETSKEVDKIFPALLKFHQEIGTVTMDKTNPFFNSKYADLSTILGTVSKPLSDNGLFLLQIPMNSSVEGEMMVNTRLIHGESGQYVSVCSVTLRKGKDPQGVISISTYLRRNSIASLLAIVTDTDEDGNDLEGTKPSANRTTPQATSETTTRRRRV